RRVLPKPTGSRRDFMLAAGLGLATAGPADAAQKGVRPSDVGRKFQPDGRVRPFAGNTIISHLPQQGAGFAAFDQLLDIYRELPIRAFARKVTALPTSSYHMTIFGGANDQGRDREPWPEGVPIDAPIERCNAILAERLAGVRLGCDLPFRMVVDDCAPPPHVSPITLHLRPADAGEAAKLKQVRDRIADALKMRAPDHDRYRFHITIAYQIEWFTRAEQAEYEAALLRWRDGLTSAGAVFELGAPEYCVFEDMFAFQRRFALPA
ncbi:MAG: DUF1868 domain-containing protein, partial [Caulobacteraceae bacterium]